MYIWSGQFIIIGILLLLWLLLDIKNVPVTGDTDEKEIDRSKKWSQPASTPRPLQVELVFFADLFRNGQPFSALGEPPDHFTKSLTVLKNGSIKL